MQNIFIRNNQMVSWKKLLHISLDRRYKRFCMIFIFLSIPAPNVHSDILSTVKLLQIARLLECLWWMQYDCHTCFLYLYLFSWGRTTLPFNIAPQNLCRKIHQDVQPVQGFKREPEDSSTLCPFSTVNASYYKAVVLVLCGTLSDIFGHDESKCPCLSWEIQFIRKEWMNTECLDLIWPFLLPAVLSLSGWIPGLKRFYGRTERRSFHVNWRRWRSTATMSLMHNEVRLQAGHFHWIQ